MKTLFVITITLRKKYNLDAGFFTDTGHPVGRILDIREIRIDPQETLYSYDVETTEEVLRNMFDKENWGKLHHQFIHFGRYKCKAINPDCAGCPFVDICTKNN